MNKKEHHQQVSYMKELRAYFNKGYNSELKCGKINQGSIDYTYFSLTPHELKKLKLKFVIILDHAVKRFTICLSGQNKAIRKEYWNSFKTSDWEKYHLAESIYNSLMIISHKIIDNPDFSDKSSLTVQIEKESIKFMKELRGVLDRLTNK